MTQQITPYPLRLDPDLRAELERSAKDAGRSLHAEIVRRLEQSVAMGQAASEPDQVSQDTGVYLHPRSSLADRLAAVEQRLVEVEQALDGLRK